MKHVEDVIQEAYRLEHRRALDADAGELRACAGAPGSDRRRTARGRAARMMELRASAAGRGTVPPAAGHPLPANGRLSGTRRKAGGAT